MENFGFDWVVFVQPAIREFFQGRDPYMVFQFTNPPWILPLVAPLGLLSPFWGAVGMNLISLSGLVALCRKAGKIWMAVPLALSFPMAVLVWMANVDGFALWGLALGGPVGLFLLSIKPQVAGLVGLVWVAQAWREGGWRKVLILTAPTLVIAVIFTLVYPHWLSVILAVPARPGGNESTGFPWYVPLGLALLVFAIRRNRNEWAALATMMVAPYARTQSWVGALVLLAVRYPLEGLIASAASWLLPVIIVRGI